MQRRDYITIGKIVEEMDIGISMLRDIGIEKKSISRNRLQKVTLI